MSVNKYTHSFVFFYLNSAFSLLAELPIEPLAERPARLHEFLVGSALADSAQQADVTFGLYGFPFLDFGIGTGTDVCIGTKLFHTDFGIPSQLFQLLAQSGMNLQIIFHVILPLSR